MEQLGHEESLAHGPFPAVEEKWLVEDTVDYPIQVNGKVRSRISVPADADARLVEEIALADEKIVALLDGNAPTQGHRCAGQDGEHRSVGASRTCAVLVVTATETAHSRIWAYPGANQSLS